MKNTAAIVKKIYPIVENAIKKNLNAYKKYIGKFISDRYEDLYAIAPYKRIYFTQKDEDDLFEVLKIDRKVISAYMQETYYASISSFNPAAAKDECTVVLLCLVRYFWKIRDEKNLDLSIINMSFSGKFYPSIHYGFFKRVQPVEYKWVMDYVVNVMITNKYDLKSKGNVINAVKSIANTWIDTYKDKFKDFEDDDCVYLIQQLHGRIKSFMKNIASLYYEAYENKAQYITYASDDYSDASYRLADADVLIAERIVDKSLASINTLSVNYKYCKMAAMSSDSLVKVDEVRDIVEYITKNNNIPTSDIREMISLLVYTYFNQSKTKDIRTMEFIKFTIQPKPNSKDTNILRIKDLTEDWLMKSSKRYVHRRNRLATKNSYHRALLMYFALVIHNSAL